MIYRFINRTPRLLASSIYNPPRFIFSDRIMTSLTAKTIPPVCRFSSARRESRRSLLWKFANLSTAFFHVNPSVSGPLVELKEPDIVRYRKLEGGVRIEEIVEGQGPEAHEGDLVEINYVCRRSNGYFVHSTVDQLNGESKPVILSLVGKEVIQGLKDVLVGMKVGGKRRAVIPPSLGYVNEDLKPIPDEFGPRRSLLSHAKEPLVFEVQLLRRF